MPASDFLSTSDIHSLEILPATSDASIRTSTPPISGSSEDDLVNNYQNSGTHVHDYPQRDFGTQYYIEQHHNQ